MNIEGIRKNYPASNLYSQKNENTNNTCLPKESNNTCFRGHFDKYSDKNANLNTSFSNNQTSHLNLSFKGNVKDFMKKVLVPNFITNKIEEKKIKNDLKQYTIKDENGNFVQRFNNTDIQKLFDLIKNNSDKTQFINDLINKKDIPSKDASSYRFSVNDIENLVNLSKDNNHQFIDDLINKVSIDYFGSPVYRFDVDNINMLVNLSKDNPSKTKILNYLIDEKTIDYHYNTAHRFSGFEIKGLINLLKNHPDNEEFIEDLLNQKTINSNNKTVPRFESYEIEKIIDIIDNNPDNAQLIKDIINEKTIDSNGNTVPRFYFYNIENLTDLIILKPKTVQKIFYSQEYNKLLKWLNSNNIHIFENKKLCNNINFMNNSEDIIKNISTPEQVKIADKILSDERLYNNENFMKKTGDIIYFSSTSEHEKIKSAMIDKILSDERLYNNENFMNKAGDVIASTSTPEQLKIKSVILDKIVSNNIFETPIGNSLCQLLSKPNPYNDEYNLVKFLDDYTKNGVEEHKELIQSALANKDLLKSGVEDISDEDVLNVMTDINTARTLHLIGLGNTEAAFPLMLEEFKFFTEDVAELNLSPENYERLIQKTNYKNSQKYIELPKQISSLKNELISSITPENQSKMKKLHAQKEILDNRIKELKQKNDSDTKQELKDLQKQSKTLGSQIQSIYFTSPNAKDLMNEISSKTKELNDMINTSKSLEPQEVVTKMRVLSGLKEIASEDEMAYFIDLIKPSTPENNANWNNAVNKKIFEKLGVEFNEELSNKLDLINCPYLSKMFVSSEDFFDNMNILVNVIKENPKLSIEEAIDGMPQNIETKKIYENLGIDYDKWTKVDKNSYTSVEIKLDAETAKQKAIENLEEDLNDELFKKLPKEVTEPILTRLENNLGVTLEKCQRDNWEGDGFSAGSSDYYRLYKNGKPIAFEDMKDIVSEIKKEINSNDFWTTKNENPEIETARGTLYTHLIKMRTNEVDNALNIKDGETAEIEVRKTNMYDIKKALGLGNDAQCCTALGRNFNEWSAPTYIMNKCIGAIELTDKGAFAGNTMIYIAKVDGKPSLVLDNIELKTKYQNNDKLRDTFVDYAKKLCEEIGQPDLPIYAGPNRHKLNMDIYPKSEHSMEIIGNSADQEVYVDYDADGHKIGNGEIANIEMYKLR